MSLIELTDKEKSQLAQLTAVATSPDAQVVLQLFHEQVMEKASLVAEGLLEAQIKSDAAASVVRTKDELVSEVSGDIWHYARKKIGFIVDVLDKLPHFQHQLSDFVGSLIVEDTTEQAKAAEDALNSAKQSIGTSVDESIDEGEKQIESEVEKEATATVAVTNDDKGVSIGQLGSILKGLV